MHRFERPRCAYYAATSSDNPQVACYKNKLSSWRSGIETDLDEVLQVHDVFVDVVNGKRAKRNEVLQAFELGDLDAVRFPFR